MLFDVGAGFFFLLAADLADHDDGVGIGVFVEHAYGVGLGGAVDGVSADTDAGDWPWPRLVSCQTAS